MLDAEKGKKIKEHLLKEIGFAVGRKTSGEERKMQPSTVRDG